MSLIHHHPSAAAIDLGATVTSIWTPHGSVESQPSLVAIDSSGSPRAHGFEAILAWGRRSSGIRLERPFAGGAIAHPELARSFLRWALRESGLRRFHGVSALLALPAGANRAYIDEWQGMVKVIGLRPMVVERPLAAVLGLGLDPDSSRAHLMVEAGGDFTEVAVVVDGAVVASRLLPATDKEPRRVATQIRSLLVTLDPDLEWDVRDTGVQVYGWSAEAMAAALDQAVDIPVVLGETANQAVIEGARRTLEEIMPYLTAV